MGFGGGAFVLAIGGDANYKIPRPLKKGEAQRRLLARAEFRNGRFDEVWSPVERFLTESGQVRERRKKDSREKMPKRTKRDSDSVFGVSR